MRTRADVDAAVLRWVEEMPGNFTRRVLDRLDGWDDDGCLTWTGPVCSGYGRVRLPAALGVVDGRNQARMVNVHRAVWLWVNGPIPED